MSPRANIIIRLSLIRLPSQYNSHLGHSYALTVLPFSFGGMSNVCREHFGHFGQGLYIPSSGALLGGLARAPDRGGKGAIGTAMATPPMILTAYRPACELLN
jgi:hypothetical protein